MRSVLRSKTKFRPPAWLHFLAGFGLLAAFLSLVLPRSDGAPLWNLTCESKQFTGYRELSPVRLGPAEALEELKQAEKDLKQAQKEEALAEEVGQGGVLSDTWLNRKGAQERLNYARQGKLAPKQEADTYQSCENDADVTDSNRQTVVNRFVPVLVVIGFAYGLVFLLRTRPRPNNFAD